MAASAVAAYFSAMGVPDTEIVSFHYELSRSVDSKGRPSSVTQGGVIHVELTSSDADSPLADWLANSYTEGDGTIRFVLPDSQKVVNYSTLSDGSTGWIEHEPDFHGRTIQQAYVFSASVPTMSH